MEGQEGVEKAARHSRTLMPLRQRQGRALYTICSCVFMSIFTRIPFNVHAFVRLFSFVLFFVFLPFYNPIHSRNSSIASAQAFTSRDIRRLTSLRRVVCGPKLRAARLVMTTRFRERFAMECARAHLLCACSRAVRRYEGAVLGRGGLIIAFRTFLFFVFAQGSFVGLSPASAPEQTSSETVRPWRSRLGFARSTRRVCSPVASGV